MALAGYCSRCGTFVWVAPDGSCANGHPSADVSGVYDAAPDSGTAAKRRPILWLVIVGLVAVVGFATTAFAARTYFVQHVAQPYVNKGDSSAPTLVSGDRVLVDKRTPASVSRGDLIAFRDPMGQHPALIKRVIAVGGDTVDIRDGRVWLNGSLLDEPYAQGDTRPGPVSLPLTVPPDSVYVLGDNRPNSGDSRHIGTVARSEVLGRVERIYWPASRAIEL